jgi:hypothetical protein
MRFGLPPPWVLASIPLFAISLAKNADARSCTVASDCPVGFACAPTDGGGSDCTSSNCQSNSDCGPGFSCYRGLYCAGAFPGGVPGNACVPQWQAPCTVDSDCGNGFTCGGSATICECSGDAGVPPDAGAVSVGPVTVPCAEVGCPGSPWLDPGYEAGTVSASCAEAGAPFSPPGFCESGSTCQCWGLAGHGLCQQTQIGACSQSTDCPMGWTCIMLACQPSNSDLAWQGPIVGCLGPSSGTAPGSGVSNGGTVSMGGSGRPTESDASSGSGESGGPTGAGGPSASGPTAKTEPPASKAGGCEIAMAARSAASYAILMLLASVARSLRRKVRPESSTR